MALTQEEVIRLKEVESKYVAIATELGKTRTAISKHPYGKAVPELYQQEKDLDAQTDAIAKERNALWEKRGYKTGYGPHNKWDQEPGHSPTW